MSEKSERPKFTKRGLLKGVGLAGAVVGLGTPAFAASGSGGKKSSDTANGTDTNHPGPNGDPPVNPHSPGWVLTPAGDQVTVGDRPMGAALSPDGRYLAVSNDGQGVQSLTLVDVNAKKVVQTIEYHSPQALFVGVGFSPDGDRLYASAGVNNKIRVYDFDGGSLSETDPIRLGPSSVKQTDSGSSVTDAEKYFPAGLDLTSDGSRLFVANNLDNSVSVVDLGSGSVTKTISVGKMPYMVTLSSDDATAYVTNWGEDTVSVVDTDSLTVTQTITVGERPNDLVLNSERPEAYVACGNTDSVSIVNTDFDDTVGKVSLRPYKDAPSGSMPNALAVSDDGDTLYVANAGNNDVAVVDLGPKQKGKGRDCGARGPTHVRGLIPTAWFPSTLALSPDDGTLYVTNMKGLGAGPNPNGPNPTKDKKNVQYIANMIDGTLSIVDVPDQSQLNKYTKQVVDNNGFDEMNGKLVRGSSKTKPRPVPRRVGDPSPIEHVIYIIKENRTYDQVLGDIEEGNGDPSLTLFGEDVTPNQHKLAKEFVLLDNLYADAEVSADGHNWSMGAIANGYVQKTWPANYSGRRESYDYENGGASRPQAGYLWDDAKRSGVSYRDYGEFADNVKKNGKFVRAKPGKDLPALHGHLDTDYPSFDLSITDQRRFGEWMKEFEQFEKKGELPELTILRFPSDHTAGTDPNYPTPRAMAADNDLAVGKLVEAVTKSQFWDNTAIFIIEDDAQNGPDHVDAHRTLGQVISPYTRRGVVDSTFYSTVSMLRTIELILGMPPMTEFDARATPMINSFIGPKEEPSTDFAYDAIKPKQSLTEVNTDSSPDAKKSLKLDLKKADEIPMQEFNRIVWHSVKGADSTMPKPKTNFRRASSPQGLLSAESGDGDD